MTTTRTGGGRLLVAVLQELLLFSVYKAQLKTLVVERGALHASVPIFHFGVRHHVIKRLQALHHPQDSKH